MVEKGEMGFLEYHIYLTRGWGKGDVSIVISFAFLSKIFSIMCLYVLVRKYMALDQDNVTYSTFSMLKEPGLH